MDGDKDMTTNSDKPRHPSSEQSSNHNDLRKRSSASQLANEHSRVSFANIAERFEEIPLREHEAHSGSTSSQKKMGPLGRKRLRSERQVKDSLSLSGVGAVTFFFIVDDFYKEFFTELYTIFDIFV